ncbi:MAG: thioredoxin family protein [Planctomycetes bacterium]|nr:thioredoxin family protein [Planctomycetota bacterium]
MKRFALVALLALPAIARADGFAWTQTIDDAKKASAGKKPIAVLLVQKGCPLSGEFLKGFLKDERMAALAQGFAWLSVEVGTPVYKDWFVKTCGGNVEGTPSLLFLNPKGENADPDYAGLATVSSPDMDDVVPVLREVLQRSKQDEPSKDKDAVKAAMEKAASAKTPGERIAAWTAAIRSGEGWHAEEKSVEEAHAGIAKALQDGSAEMLRIFREVRDPAEQKAAFEKAKADYAGTSVGEWAGEEGIKIKVKK